MKKIDKIIIVVLVIFISIFGGIKYYYSNLYHSTNMVNIYLNGVLYQQVPLDDENLKEGILIEKGWGKNLIQQINGKVQITEANCPDELCTKMSPIVNSGEIIVCLPNKLLVEVEGELK